MTPTFRNEEKKDATSAATQSDVEIKIEANDKERVCSSTSGVKDSDAESKASVAFKIDQKGLSVRFAADSDAEHKEPATSQDEQAGFSKVREKELDTESKMTDESDDDGSSTTTSEDSEGEDNDDDTCRRQSGPPPPYEMPAPARKKKLPPFEADPVRYVLGIKLPTADNGLCACNMVTSTYSVVFYVTCYGALLIADSFGGITPIIRALYAYKFQLFLTTEEQNALHGWTGILMLFSAFMLWLATYRRSRPMLMVWVLVMLVYVLMTLVVFLLGMLLSFAADGWNVHSTTGISVGLVDFGLEVFLLYMVYSMIRYMDEKPPGHNYFDPHVQAVRQYELAQLGYREINIMGIPMAAPIPEGALTGGPPSRQVTTV